ncbi:PTS system glucose-specific IIA component [Breznakia sp. PF5-3]|uniref:PTS sugar transporter subunit IIA n=1 Tax=unclassified Breznakia TaxID=2623764 RepID=UPI002406A26E|nr:MULTISPECIES: glucose PTS transporter subunit IIA [unclassified Breznakia]MDF9824022.1 PTS system glucose-specific IIA component [Breznakia sp. PM6-1]MDF9834821.1 PTS system glucose-specific IIA component [Breznakia sp. PF5-3]MDF9838140.1 PTS system glucose-specific IIA component [Breznakia sp. PFB2-8]MDF9860126.1 PTS system glucose-specific IIA component [Breznakia sp. PH5-24]
MFQRFSKRKKHLDIFAPVDGQTMSLDQVDDPVFSGRIMGEGIAINTHCGKVYAPADGTIAVLAKTKHAVAMKLNNGIELLIHVGIHTDTLTGNECLSHVETGQRVKKGELLLTFDSKKMCKETDIVVPIIVLNSSQHPICHLKIGTKAVVNETVLFEVQ